MQPNPSTFIPSDADQFIGQTAKLARILTAKATTLKQSPSAVKLLIVGASGIGKTAICNMFAGMLAAHSSAIQSINGRDLNADVVRGWKQSAIYRPMCGGHSVIIVNELDLASPAAQDLLLSFLDELPAHYAVLATSNLNLSGLAERFQSRFQQFRLASPSAGEIATLLERFGLNGQSANIAERCKGNVRAALLDAQSFLDAKELAA